MSRDQYDEIAVAFAYLHKHFLPLLTPLERRVARTVLPITSKSQHPIEQKIHAFLENRDGHVLDDQILEAYRQPRHEFLQRAVTRISKLHNPKLPRCKQCARIVHVPQPLSCPWCRCQQPTLE